MIATKLVNTAVGAALENRAQLKPVVAPLALAGKGVVMILWGTFWKGALAQLAITVLWLGAFMFTYLTTQSPFMANWAVTVLVAFVVFVVTPMTVLVTEVIRVRKLVAIERDARKQAEQDAAAQAEAEYAASLAAQRVPAQSADAEAVNHGEYTVL